jgi:tripartite-type tricarboxylate transporter receptor subunit TctC
MACAASAACAQAPWKPERNVEILIASTAGTGPDRLARMIQRLWSEQKNMTFTTSVVTRPGGGGTILWSYMNQRRGDPHHLMITSYNIVVNHIVGKSALTYTDFTPVSLLVSEWIGYSVRADSPYKTLGDLVNALKADPGAFAIAVSSNAGGSNHNWRIVMAPKDLTAVQASYWDDAFRRLATSEEWNKDLQAQHLANSYLGAADLRKYLDRQYGEVRQVLTDLGMAKAPAD